MNQLVHRAGKGLWVQVHILLLPSLPGDRYHLEASQLPLHRLLRNVTRLLGSVPQVRQGMVSSC